MLDRRLNAQKIEASDLDDPAQAVEWMLAVQGQDYAGAKWSLGLRAPGSSEADVEAQFAAGRFARTWVMRGTLHLVNAADLHWLLALLGPRVIAMSARRYAELELDEAVLLRSRDLIVEALGDGEPRGRKELLSMLESSGISTAGQRAPFILQRASLEGSIYQCAVRRGEPVFRLLPPAPEALPGREEALRRLALRYFSTRGPASLEDFAWWSGLTLTDARLGLSLAEGDLLREEIDERTCWCSPDEQAAGGNELSAHLLPGFDEYVISYQDRSAIMDVKAMRERTPPNGMLPATIVIAGRVAGNWKRTLKKDRVQVHLHPDQALSPQEAQAVESAAQQYGSYLRLPLELDWAGAA